MIDVDALSSLRTSGIYAFLNMRSGKWYVGQATNIYNRRSRHTVGMHCGKGQNAHLQAAYNKYGDAAFTFMVLEFCEPNNLTEREQAWMNAIGGDNLYNKAPAAGSCRGLKASAETRAKMSAVRRGVKKTPEHVAKVTLAIRERFRRLGLEAKPKPIRRSTPKKLTQAHIAALAAGRRRVGWSAESREKVAAAHRGKPLSEAHRAALRLGQKQRPPISEVTRARMSAARSAYYAARRSQ